MARPVLEQFLGRGRTRLWWIISTRVVIGAGVAFALAWPIGLLLGGRLLGLLLGLTAALVTALCLREVRGLLVYERLGSSWSYRLRRWRGQTALDPRVFGAEVIEEQGWAARVRVRSAGEGVAFGPPRASQEREQEAT